MRREGTVLDVVLSVRQTFLFMLGKERRKSLIHYLPVYGCISTGVIYLGIGIIAILSFLKLKEGGADESSLLVFLNHFIIGKVVIVIILLGTVSYISWRIYEAFTDPYGYGNDVWGRIKRTGIALSTVADILIAYTAIEALLGIDNMAEDGRPEQQQQLVANILQQDFGNWITITIGIIVLITALIQFLYGITKGYRERIDIEHFNSGFKKFVHVFAWTGYLARGIILGIIGFFFTKAGMEENARYVVNTDKAFDFIGDSIGHTCFILVAIGTICYGLFMFALGVAYDSDRD
jgi:hypothetical protein